jgi:hypothetical protein
LEVEMRQIRTVLGLVLLCSPVAFAQEPAAPPPGMLRVTREQFRPGNMATHNKQIPAFYALFEKAKVGSPRLGLVPVSGDQNHILYFDGYPSAADMEATDRKMDEVMGASPALQAEMDALSSKNDPLHESQTVMLATFRPDLSYHPNTREQTGRARYFNVTVLRVNVGRGVDWADYTKQTNAAREKAGLDEHTAVYAVGSGAPAGTFLILSTMRSLSEVDAAAAGGAARAQKMTAALGGESVVAARRKTNSELVAQATTTLYAIDRGISRPRPEFVAADPDFWKSKEMPKPAPPVKKK